MQLEISNFAHSDRGPQMYRISGNDITDDFLLVFYCTFVYLMDWTGPGRLRDIAAIIPHPLGLHSIF